MPPAALLFYNGERQVTHLNERFNERLNERFNEQLNERGSLKQPR